MQLPPGFQLDQPAGPQPMIRGAVKQPTGYGANVAPVSPQYVQGQAQVAGAEAAAREAAQRATIAFQTQQAIAEAAAKHNIANQPKPAPVPTADQLRLGRIDALDKIIAAQDAVGLSKNKYFSTGFLAPTMANFGGTPARSVQAKTSTLKSAGALKDIIAMAQANGGKNPLTPMSNSDVELIASGKANLDIGQDDQSFQDAVGLYEDAYRRAFQAAGGKPQELPAAVAWRRRVQAKQQGKSVGSQVIKFDAQGNRIK